MFSLRINKVDRSAGLRIRGSSLITPKFGMSKVCESSVSQPILVKTS